MTPRPARITYFEGGASDRLPVGLTDVARTLRDMDDRPHRPSTVARAIADTFKLNDDQRERFLREAGAVRSHPYRKRSDVQQSQTSA